MAEETTKTTEQPVKHTPMMQQYLRINDIWGQSKNYSAVDRQPLAEKISKTPKKTA